MEFADIMETSKLAYTILEAVDLTGFSRSVIYQEIGSGRLRAIKRGRRTAILANDLDAWLTTLPTFKPESEARQ